MQHFPGTFLLDLNNPSPRTYQILRALDSEQRVTILRYLSQRPESSINDMSAALSMPASTVAQHIKELEEAGLAYSELRPANRGLQKVCSPVRNQQILIKLPHVDRMRRGALNTSMPIGAYVDCMATPTCGLATDTGIIGELDNPVTFYQPERLNAQLIWMRQGYLEYRFPSQISPNAQMDSLVFSMEIASEAPRFNENYPSDITLWVNEIEIGSWCSPGDFGSQRGVLTPEWWGDQNSQYGLLKIWKVGNDGCYVDGLRISDVCLDDLNLPARSYVSMRVGVKEDAAHVGGLNLFGRKFGNYPQDIVMTLHFRQPEQPEEPALPLDVSE